MDNSFSKDDTWIAKAVALIFMFMHHLWWFPERLCGGELKHWIDLSTGESLPEFLGCVGKICVSMFFFLGGYGIYMSSKNKPFDLVKRLKKLYVSYWKIFLVLVPIGIIFFSNQEDYCAQSFRCHVFEDANSKYVILGFLGVSDKFDGNWWFFFSYVVAVITFPLVRKIVERHTFAVNLAIVVVFGILMNNVFPALGSNSAYGLMKSNSLYSTFFMQDSPFIACFWMGVIVAKDDILVRLKASLRENDLFHMWFMIFLIVAGVCLRRWKFGAFLDLFSVPVLCVAFAYVFGYFRLVKAIFVETGKKSMAMWLIHGFFCYHVHPLAWFITRPRYALPCLLLLLLCSYVTAVVIELLWRAIGIVYKKIDNTIKKRGAIQ